MSIEEENENRVILYLVGGTFDATPGASDEGVIGAYDYYAVEPLLFELVVVLNEGWDVFLMAGWL
jgi:hypothetical protein